ncbi:hypothetical protein jaqu_19300 [Jannaschia aquimarina]|uniref:Uncharacterized protein n=1 Tax=Jannaschia aquimarina TaxID=935700 RepID=A0A0D1EFE7_9RHOB|nr:hypothetical protein jaqu_19300 [Jannaschia aquimarina]SNT26017.1 hypothetical protein SAMN05421775_10955 [Jannaschia aquimarina]
MTYRSNSTNLRREKPAGFQTAFGKLTATLAEPGMAVPAVAATAMLGLGIFLFV